MTLSAPVLLPCAVLSCALAFGMAAPNGLSTEYRTDPIGLDTPSPRLSWRLGADAAPQVAYELDVDGRRFGWTESADQIGIPWPDVPLATSQRVRWRVRVRDEKGAVSDWSQPAEFTMGVMDGWSASWIAADPATQPEEDMLGARWLTAPGATNGLVTLTTSFDVTPEDLRGVVDMVHVGLVQPGIEVNGLTFHKWHGHAHDWRRACFRDLGPYLHVGRNAMTVTLRPGIDRVPEVPLDRVRHHAADECCAFLAKIVFPSGRRICTRAADWSSPEGAVTDLGGLRETAFGRDVLLRTESLAPAFARRFSVAKEVRSAVLHVTGVGHYEALLNGAKIGDKVLDPSPTAYDRRVLYSTYRLDGLVRKGENELTIRLGHGWYDVRSQAVWNFETAPWRDFPRTIARLDLAYADGTTERVVTDGSWRQVRNPVAYDDFYEGEVIDPAALVSPPAADVRAAVCPGPSGRLQAEAQPGARIVRELAATRVTALGDGAYLIEFPEDVAGWMRLTVRGQRRGDVLSLRYDERVSPEPAPAVPSARNGLDTARPPKPAEWRHIDEHFCYAASHRVCARDAGFQTDRYVCTGMPEETYEPRFTYKGFRAVLVKGLARAPARSEAVACVIRTDFPAVGTFDCSDETFNMLMRMGERSYCANFADGIPTDCPHREKNGWTGDASIASELAQYAFENTAGYEKWLRDIVDAQLPDGMLPGIVPTSGWGYVWGNGPAWDSALPVVAWNLWIYRGDRRILDEIEPALERYLAYTASRADGAGLVRHGLGDWVPVAESHRPSTEYVSSCYYLQAQEIAARIADLRGDASAAARRRRSADRTRAGLVARYGREDGVFDNGGQTAQALALAFGLATETSRPAVERRLVAAVLRADCHYDTGIIGAKHVLRALSRQGRHDLAWRMVVNPTSPSMTDWIRKGGTALWEDWADGSSRNHVMFGDFVGWAYQYLAGLRLRESSASTSAVTVPVAPAFRDVTVEPVFLRELTHLTAATETPYGRLGVAWRRTDRLRVTVTVPPGVRAEVRLPDRAPFVQAPGTAFYEVAEP